MITTKTLVPFPLLPVELAGKVQTETEPEDGTVWTDEQGTMFEYVADLSRWFKITPAQGNKEVA